MKKSEVIRSVFLAIKASTDERISYLKRETHPWTTQFMDEEEKNYKMGELEEAKLSLSRLYKVADTLWQDALKEEQNEL